MRTGRSISATGLALVAAITLITTGSAAAEERVLEEGKWYPSLESGINLSQSAYSDNWAGGDKGSIVWTFITNASLENQFNPAVNWNNTLKLAFGQTHQQAERDGERFWEAPEKSTDLIDLESTLRFTLHKWVDPFLSVRLETQFQDASDDSGRTLSLNPISLKETGGVARMFFDEEDRSLLSRVGFTVRQNHRKFFTSPDPGETSTVGETETDGGFEWITDYKSKIFDNKVAWTSKVDLYKPLFYSGKETFDDLTDDDFLAAGINPDVGDYSLALEVDWENIFTAQITSILSVNLYTQWVYNQYDNSVAPQVDAAGALTNAADVAAAIRKAGQFKQTLAIGVTYRFL